MLGSDLMREKGKALFPERSPLKLRLSGLPGRSGSQGGRVSSGLGPRRLGLRPPGVTRSPVFSFLSSTVAGERRWLTDWSGEKFLN